MDKKGRTGNVQKQYLIYHLTDSGQARKILQELTHLEGLQSAHISDDLKILCVDAQAEYFSAIMDQAVNICRRISGECELTYRF